MADGLSSQEIFSRLKKAFSLESTRSDLIANSSQLILFAENVLKNEASCSDIVLECVDMYMSLNSTVNQFYIRGLICKGMCLAREQGKDQDCLRYFVKAVTLAKKSPCYYFLVYNISVCVYAVIRDWSPVSVYTNGLVAVVKALEETKNENYVWRLTLLMCLIQSQSTGQYEEAVKPSRSLLELVRTHLPFQLVTSYRQLVGWGLVNEVNNKDLKTHPQLNVLMKLWKIKNSDYPSHLSKLLLLAVNGDTAGKKTTPPLRDEILNAVLLEIGETSLQFPNCSSVALKCIENLTDLHHNEEFRLRKELLEGEIAIQTSEGDIFSTNNIQLRKSVIDKAGSILDQCIKNSLNGSLIESVCINMWNMSLPLLQPTLRHYLLKPLTTVCDSLASIKSLLKGLRIMVHVELMKINSDTGSIDTALNHIQLVKSIDSEGSYEEYLKWNEHRLKLRNNIYQSPHDPLDKAIQMLEQLKYSDIVTSSECRPLLITISDLLTDGQFSHLLNTTLIPNQEDSVTLRDRMQLYKDTVTCTDDEYDKIRCWVWSELATISRKNSLWDVCQLSCLYALKYDDQRWMYTPTHQIPSKRSSKKKLGSSHSMTTPERVTSSNSLFSLPYTVPPALSMNKDMLLLIAQTHCIYAEVLVHVLQCEGLTLGQKPQGDNDNEEWIKYCEWIAELTSAVHSSYLRASEMGTSLEEAWLVYNVGVYLWNYHRGMLTAEHVHVFRTVYDILQATCNNDQSINYTVLLTHIGTLLCRGLTSKWLPSPSPRSSMNNSSTTRAGSNKKKDGRASSKSKKKDAPGGLEPEAIGDIKDSLTICESLMNQFGKSLPLSVVDPLLKVWVLNRFLLQSPITNLVPYETLNEQCVKAIISVEMYSVQSQFSFYEFPNCPSLEEVEETITNSSWPSHSTLPLELYSLTANSACIYNKSEVVKKCCEKALEYKGNNLLLSSVSCLLGQKTNDVWAALNYFKNSSRFACKGGLYDKVIQCCRYSWNISTSLIGTTSGRLQLKDVFIELIDDVMKLAGRRVQGNAAVMSPNDVQLISDMYTVIFTVYSDKSEWVEGLKMTESALWDSPKSLHQTLMKYKILFKCRLGASIEGEMLRYSEEVDPNSLSDLWYELGNASAGNELFMRQCYEKAIELSSSDNKLHYIIELARFFHRHGYSYNDVMTQLKTGAGLCSTHLFNELDTLLQLNVMMYTCTCDEEYCLKGVACVMLIMKDVANYCNMEEWGQPLSLTDECISEIEGGETTLLPSANTIHKPLLTIHYLQVLIDGLTLHSLHLLILPVLQLQLLIAKHIVHSQPLYELIQLRLNEVCQTLQLTTPSVHYTLTVHDISSGRINSRTVNDDIIDNNINIASVWSDMGLILIKQGRYQSASELLTEAKRLCQTTCDSRTLASVLLGEIKILIFEKKFEQAIEKLNELQVISTQYGVWLEMIECYCTVITNSSELLRCLYKGLESINEVMTGHLLSVMSAIVKLKIMYYENKVDKKKVQEYIDTLVKYGHTSSAVNALSLLCQSSDNDTLQLIKWNRQIVKILQSTCHHVIKITKPNKGVVLPVQRELVNAQLKLAELLLSVVMVTVAKGNKVKENVSQKSSIEKMIDDYVYEEPVLNNRQQEWEETARSATSEALSLINNSYNSTSDTSVQTHCLCICGCLMMESSCHWSPDVLDAWLPWLPHINEDANELSALSTVMRTQESLNAKVNECFSVTNLSCGVQCLLVAISEGLKLQDLGVVKRSSLKLIDIFGVNDPLVTSLLLALYQSCTVSLDQYMLLRDCVHVPETSQLSTLLQQYSSTPTSHHDYDSVINNLQLNYECWRRLKVNVNHFELLKSFHCDMRFIILQSSPDKSYMYCGYLLPTQPPPPAPKKGQPPIEHEVLLPVTGRYSLVADDLLVLNELMKEYHHTLLESCQKDKNKLDEMIQVQFDGIITGLEALLHESISLLTTTLDKEDGEKELTVVLLLDDCLMEFPIEAMSFLQRKNIKNISRDFSLQFLHHRLKGMNFGSEETTEEDKKKVDKYQPQPSSYLGNINNFKYIIDPRNDLGDGISQDIKSLIDEYPKQTCKWTGHFGTHHTLNHGEWASLMNNSTGMIVLCSEKFLNHYPSQYLPSLNLPSTSFAIVMDLLSSVNSFNTQSKLDLYKSHGEKEMENSLVYVKLLSLIGVNCIYCHQWRDTVSNGLNELKTLIRGILTKPVLSGRLQKLTEGSSYDVFNGIIYGLPHITFVPEAT